MKHQNNMIETKSPKRILAMQIKEELINLKKNGISLLLQGSPASPARIAYLAGDIKHDSTYMRDYIADEAGQIKAVNFSKVNLSTRSRNQSKYD